MKRFIPLLLVIPVVLAVWAAYTRMPGSAGVLDAVARARPERTFTPRFSIAVDHQPCMRASLPADSVVPRERCGQRPDAPLAMEKIADAGALSLAPDTLQASALSSVLWWDNTEVSLNEAVTHLSEALRLGGDSIAVLVDLSGVHLSRAQATQNSKDLWVGLEYALNVLDLDPANHAALFNAALALDALALDELARVYWDSYLAADPSSVWADEARERRRALVPPKPVAKPTTSWTLDEVNAFAVRHPQEAREHGWESVLGAWGTAVLQNRPARADSLLLLAERLGKALVDNDGDATLLDAVGAIHAVRADRIETRTLARGHRAYAVGRDLFEIAKRRAAADSFALVLRLQPLSPVLMAWARAFHGATLVYNKELDRAMAVFDTLIAETDTMRHRALAARVRWMSATSLSRKDANQGDREVFEVASRFFRSLGERESLGATLKGQGWGAYTQGDTVPAYQLMHQALLALRDHPGSPQLHNALVESAEMASRDGLLRVALLVEEADVVATKGARNPTIAPEALLARARIRAISGQLDAARADLDTAALLMVNVPLEEHAENLRQVMRYSHAVAALPGRATMARLDSTIAHIEKYDPVWLLPALMRRVELRFASGDTTGANADLDSITAKIRRTSREARGSHVRAAILEQARSRFDKLVMMEVRAGRPLDALYAVERGRVSFAPEGSASTARAPWLSPPPGQVVVEYTLIGDTLLTWIIQRDSITLREQLIDRNELRYTIDQAVAALEAGRDSVALPHLHRLHGWLIHPVKDRLGPTGTSLVILADGEIAGVPLHALSDGPGGRMVLEDHPLRYATSLEDAVRPVTRVPERSALLIANPYFDAMEHPTLGRLNGAADEVKSLQRLYPGAVVLGDRLATADAFRANAPRASVIHYAGHAIFDDTRPERSFLVLAGAGDSGRFRANSVSTLELSGVRMVVLSACRTVRARQGRSGGFAGLSGALLSAGADGVVGSLWEVSDQLTHPLMVAFHEAYRDSGDPVAALQQAQLTMLQSKKNEQRALSAWAGFRYVGR